jgi:hypothetical protein
MFSLFKKKKTLSPAEIAKVRRQMVAAAYIKAVQRGAQAR